MGFMTYNTFPFLKTILSDKTNHKVANILCFYLFLTLHTSSVHFPSRIAGHFPLSQETRNHWPHAPWLNWPCQG